MHVLQSVTFHICACLKIRRIICPSLSHKVEGRQKEHGEREEDGTKGMGNERKGTGSAHTHTVERREMQRKMETLVINYLL